MNSDNRFKGKDARLALVRTSGSQQCLPLHWQLGNSDVLQGSVAGNAKKTPHFSSPERAACPEYIDSHPILNT
jgi:hypothetical protein